MLYPALPPAPPPIIVTLTPQQAAGISPTNNNEVKQQTSSNQVACPAETSTSKKSNLVSHLLGKILLDSYRTNGNCSDVDSNISSSTENIQVASNQLNESSPEQASNQHKNIQKTAKLEENNQNSAMDSGASSSLSQRLKNQPVAANSTTTTDNVGQMLAAVQKLVAVSLYASLNPSLYGETSPSTPAQTDDNSKDEKSKIAAQPKLNPSQKSLVARLNSNKNQNQDNQNSQVATNPYFDSSRIIALVQGLINSSISASLNQNIKYNVNFNANNSNLIASSEKTPVSNSQQSETPEQTVAATGNNPVNQNNNSQEKSPDAEASTPPESTIQLAQAPGEPFLVALTINGREIGTLDIIKEDNLLFIPLESFAEIAGFTAEGFADGYTIKTPLGEVNLEPSSLRTIKGLTYISSEELATQLQINLELNTADLTLAADLPWRGGSQQGRKVELEPDFLAPRNGISTLRQELSVTSVYGKTRFRSSTQLGGRLAGGSWRARLNNNFVNQPDISEYFFYKRSGRFRFQVGRQQIGLHPLINSIDLTGLQFGFTNLPAESFGNSYSANELLPRRSRPMQTFRGEAPPASIAQLRVAGIPVAQQVVGFDGQYEFLDVNLPIGRNNEIEVAIFDRSNLSIPITVRSARINASDVLLPAGGNVQLGGVGFSGNLVQNTFFDNLNSDYSGQFVGFYQLRQGLSQDLTFEGSVQAAPNAFQSQAGLVWRMANPLVVSASVGTSDDKLGYTAGFDLQLDKLDINATSQFLPEGFSRTGGREEKTNHSIEVEYRPSNKFQVGFIARRFKDEIADSNYILPTFTIRPFSTLSVNGRPDIEGRYLVNAFYRPNWRTKLALSSFGGIYNSDLSYRLSKNYELSLGNEFGEDAPGRYSLSFGRKPNNFRSLAWSLGLAVREGEVAPLASASMQVLPGLLGRVEYQGIPSRSRGLFGGFGDDRFTVSLVSDLSFASGRVTPATYSGITKERGAIAGRLTLENQLIKRNLGGSRILVVDNRNRIVNRAVTDANGNFFVGGLREGMYTVELDPDGLPVEISTPKTSFVAQVANSAVTKIDFPLRIEYGIAGRITDVAGQPIDQIKVELINDRGARVISGTTDEYGLYRLDGVPVGKYTLQIPNQEDLGRNETLPKRQVEISNDFVYNQNLKLSVSAAAWKQKQGQK